MSALASVLPFLAALKKQVPDFSGMTADSPDPNDMTDQVNRQSMVAASQQPPMGPPMASSIPQQDPQPDMSIGAPPQPQPPPPNPVGDIAQSMTQGAAPKYRPTKAHELVDILRGGIVGGLAGVEQNAQTYAQTGRNAGFGGGVAGAIQLPFQQAYQRGELAQQQAQTELTKSQSQMVQTPYGPMAAGLAKLIFPALVKAGGTVEAAKVGAQGRVGAAEVTAGKPVVVPGRGLYQKDESGQYQPVQGAEVPQVLVTAEEAQTLGHPELANQEIDMGRYSQLLRGVSSQTVPVQGAAGASLVNKNTAKTTPLGLGSPGVAVAMARPVQVADPNNPGNITYQSAGQAMQQGAMAPASAPAVTAKATARAVAPGGKVGEEINAFNTAIQHADLLQKAGEALHNGDVQALNSLKNRFANEFGATGPITANTIAQAYTREITKMLSSGHMTDSEIGQVGSTLDPNRQSLPQMMGVLNAYKALAASKMQVRQQGVQQGMQGKPNFQGASPAVKVGDKVTLKNGQTITVKEVHPDGSFD